MTALARMPDAAVTRVEVAPRRWSREYDACQGWGATEGRDHHRCLHPDGAEFDQGRCIRCHRMHQGWLVRQETGAAAQPAPTPRAITLTVPDPAPTPAPSVPTPLGVVPRAWHKHYDCCVQCGTIAKQPASRGLCTTCYPPSTMLQYRGHAGPRLDRRMSEVEQRALVDAYLATITIPTPLAATGPAPAPTPRPIAPPEDAVKRCARCGADKTEDGFSASMWSESRKRGSRWCRACDRAYHDERKAALADPAASTNGAVVIETGWELDRPAPVLPPPALVRSVADELRALLDTLARERAALEEDRVRVNQRLEELRCQVGAVETTLALVSRT